MKPLRLGISDSSTQPLLVLAAGALLVAPIAESLAVIGLIAVLRRFGYTAVTQVAVSALAISSLHSLSYPIWGILVAPTFLIGGAAYVYWRKTSFYLAAGMIIGLHFISNVKPILSEIARRTHS